MDLAIARGGRWVVVPNYYFPIEMCMESVNLKPYIGTDLFYLIYFFYIL